MATRKPKVACVEPPVYVTSGNTRKVHRLRVDGNSKCGLVDQTSAKRGYTLATRAITLEDASHRRAVCINCFPDGLTLLEQTPEAALLEAREYAEWAHVELVSHGIEYSAPPWLVLPGRVEIGKEEE